MRVATYGGDLGRMSAECAVSQVQIAMSDGVYYLDGGWQTLVSGLLGAATGSGVDVRTGEVVTTAIGTGDGKRSRVSGGALVAMLPVAGGFTKGSSNARDAQLAEASRQAVEAASAGLVSAAARLVSGDDQGRRSTQSPSSPQKDR